jgi:hypothetical protein
MNVRLQKQSKTWKITKLDLQHNHAPLSDLVLSYKNRVANLSDEQRELILSMGQAFVPAELILTCFRLKFPDGPNITARDIVNLKPPSPGGSCDAHNLLEKLLALHQEDNNWFLRWVHAVVTSVLLW